VRAALTLAASLWAATTLADGPRDESFAQHAARVEVGPISELLVQNHGRAQPFDSVAREAMTFLTGEHEPFGLPPVQSYLGYLSFPGQGKLELIELRDAEVRDQLGQPGDQRYFSLEELSKANLERRARPVLQKEASGAPLTSAERGLAEAFRQYALARELASGGHLLHAVDLSGAGPRGPLVESARQYLKSVQSGAADAKAGAQALVKASLEQVSPDDAARLAPRFAVELFLNRTPVAGMTGWACLLAAALLLVPRLRRAPPALASALVSVPLALQAVALGARSYVTGLLDAMSLHASVTWVALGAAVVGAVAWLRSRNAPLASAGLGVSGLLLLLAASSPVSLKAGLDTDFGVLRSNFWLSLHVLACCAAYTGVLAAAARADALLASMLVKRAPAEVEASAAAQVMRLLEASAALLVVGLLAGGLWAERAWGRFWGWDPKESWALVLALGLWAMLEARRQGWLSPFGTLLAAPLAFLGVLVSWYGVNVAWATGLHAYGFASGGAVIISAVAGAQVLLLAAVMAVRNRDQKPVMMKRDTNGE